MSTLAWLIIGCFLWALAAGWLALVVGRVIRYRNKQKPRPPTTPN